MEDRYFVVSQNDYIIKGTKNTGYATLKSAKLARQRVDERDAKNGRGFTPIRVILGEAY